MPLRIAETNDGEEDEPAMEKRARKNTRRVWGLTAKEENV